MCCQGHELFSGVRKIYMKTKKKRILSLLLCHLQFFCKEKKVSSEAKDSFCQAKMCIGLPSPLFARAASPRIGCQVVVRRSCASTWREKTMGMGIRHILKPCEKRRFEDIMILMSCREFYWYNLKRNEKTCRDNRSRQGPHMSRAW